MHWSWDLTLYHIQKLTQPDQRPKCKSWNFKLLEDNMGERMVSKDTIKRAKRQFTKWETILENTVSDKGLILMLI